MRDWEIHGEGFMDVTVVHGHTSTIAIVKASVPSPKGVSGEFVARGESRLYPGDKNVPEVGSMIAVANALASLSIKIKSRALGIVKHYDDMAIQNDDPQRGYRKQMWQVEQGEDEGAISLPRGAGQ